MTTSLAVVPPSPTITAEQLALIKKTIAKDATPVELELFLYDNARRGIHPLDRLLHFTKRGGRYTPVVSIDLLRSRAAMTGEYAGQDDAVFAGTAKAAAFTATVTIYRFIQAHRCAFTASARWSEYRPDAAHMWDRMPFTMLAKCAEALALRKGFPQELSGLYEAAELDQAGPAVNRETGELHEDNDKTITPAQQKRLHAIATTAGWSPAQLKKFLFDELQIETTKALRVADYDEFCRQLEEGTDARQPQEDA